MDVAAIDYGEREVFTVAAFNRGIAAWLARLPSVWVEGEVTELRRNPAWQNVFLTLKDPEAGATVKVTMARARFDALKLELADGERVHVHGRAEIYEARGELSLRATAIERVGMGEHLARLERLKAKLAAEGLFAEERKRPLPRFPRRIGLVTGREAAAKGDVLKTIAARFPPARVLVATALVQGPRAVPEVIAALAELAAQPEVDVIVVARGGGSFEDLLPFSDERLVRAFAACPVPVVSAVGHEQDTPLCDFAADVRASTPTAAGRLVVPDAAELLEALERARGSLARGARRTLERRAERLTLLHEGLARGARRTSDRHAQALALAHDRLRRAPALLVERRRAALEGAAGRLRALSPRATLERGYAIVRLQGHVLRAAASALPGDSIDVELAAGSLAARVEEVSS